MLEAVVRQSLGVGAGERVVVVTDPPQRPLAELFVHGAARAAADVRLLVMPVAREHGSEPPPRVAEAMASADVCLLPTSKSLSHTHARQAASAAGARIASMPSITYEMAMRTLRVDYAAIARVTEALADMLSAADTARLTSPGGSDLHLDLTGRRGLADTGVFTAPGAFGNLPAGEAFIAPLEGRAHGTLVMDAASLALDDQIPSGGEPLVLTVRDGRVCEMHGPGVEALRVVFAQLGGGARTIAELGIGANPAARVTGNLLESEKVVGTAHVALGSNVHFGGVVDVPFHRDGVIDRPTIAAGGAVLIDDGRLAV